MTRPKDGAPAIEWALFYASLGWAVFPVQPRSKTAFYSYPEYKNKETGNAYSWQAQASADPERVRKFWTDHPEAGIGVATGSASGGLYVLDLDREKPATEKSKGSGDGRKHLLEWQGQPDNGEIGIADTICSVTGSGGNQLFFKSSEAICGTHAGIFPGYGVDTRGEGGYCILPPSTHPNGKPYRWKRSPGDFELHKPNKYATKYLLGAPKAPKTNTEPSKSFELPEIIGAGIRSDTLISKIGQLVEKNPDLPEDDIERIIRQINDERCDPPLDERELERQIFPAIRRFRNRQAAAAFTETDPADYHKRSVAAYLPTFLDDIGNLTPPIPTGFQKLDTLLGGGLHTGLYILGALSSMGKTTFILQLANQLASSGNDVLFFSLEQSRAELIAKTLSNLTATIEAAESGQYVGEAKQLNANALPNAKTALQITDPTRITNAEEDKLLKAAMNVFNLYAAHLWIIEGEEDLGAEKIRSYVEQHIKITGNTPIVFLDYLQILKAKDPRQTDKTNVDKSVSDLRRIAREFNAVVFAVSSLNRSSYAKAIDMDAFKESGGIEYGSDVLLGLQSIDMTIAENSREVAKNIERTQKTKRQLVRKVELKILKNRNGITGKAQQFLYTSPFNVFEEAEEDLSDPQPISKTRTRKKSAADGTNARLDAMMKFWNVPFIDTDTPDTDPEDLLD